MKHLVNIWKDLEKVLTYSQLDLTSIGYMLVKVIMLNNREDIAFLGAHRGYQVALLSTLAHKHRRKVWAFDSFKGYPGHQSIDKGWGTLIWHMDLFKKRM